MTSTIKKIFFSLLLLNITFYSMEHLFGTSGSVPPNILCTHNLFTRGQSEKLKILTPCKDFSATANHQCVISIVLFMNPKHSTIGACMRKMNSISARLSTLDNLQSVICYLFFFSVLSFLH